MTLLCAVFALLSFAIGAARGLVPIFLAEGCGWAILAVYFWRRQQPLPPLAIMIFFLSAIIVATVQFYSLTRHFGVVGRSRYNYLQRGSTLFRIDESAGRTDRLTEQGQWIPTNFDRPPEITHDITGIIMDEGSWSNGTHEICFVVANHSQYVLGSIQIRVILAENSQDNAAAGWLIDLKPIGLMNVGEKGILCGSQPTILPQGKTWAYSFESAEGWKRTAHNP